MDKTYRIFVNGKFFNGSDDYNFAYNRALGLAMFFGLEFINTKSKHIMDKWIGDKMILITKNPR